VTASMVAIAVRPGCSVEPVSSPPQVPGPSRIARRRSRLGAGHRVLVS
jgi:hypothetical protein